MVARSCKARVVAIWAGLLSCAAFAQAGADGRPVHPADVYARDPRLRELMSGVRFWAGFEESAQPVWGESYGGETPAVRGVYRSAPGLVGAAFVSEQRSGCLYPAEGNLDLRRPGAVSFWVCPVRWDRSEPTGIRNGLFMTNFSKQGYLGINRTAATQRDGLVVRNDQVFFYADHFPGARNVRIMLGSSLGPEWADGAWHLFVVNWKGSHFEVSLDGRGLVSGDLGCPLDPAAVTQIIVGSCLEPTLIDEFMVHRNPLSERDIRGLMEVLCPRRTARE